MSLCQDRDERKTVHPETNAGYNSLEAGLEFKDPGQDVKLAPFRSYGLLSGKFSCDITADAVSP